MINTKDYAQWKKLTTLRMVDELPPEQRMTYKKILSAKTALVNKGLRIIKVKAGITKPLTTHISRHTFAGLAQDIHTDNSILQGLFKHSSLRTTERYMKRFDTASKDEALKEIIKPLTRKPAKRSLAEQLAEIPEAELRAFLKAYNKKKK